MKIITEYRANAQAALGLAIKSQDGDYRTTMLRIAQAWHEMAERAEKNAGSSMTIEQELTDRNSPLAKKASAGPAGSIMYQSSTIAAP